MYCSELHNYESNGYNTVLECSQHQRYLQSILREEVEIVIAVLKKEKCADVDNIPEELVQAGGVTIIDVLRKVCYKWKAGKYLTL